MADVLKPQRAGLAAARAVVDGRICGACSATSMTAPMDPCPRCKGSRRVDAITDAREAWEALATRGVIPMEWVEDPRRAFACAICNGTGRDVREAREWDGSYGDEYDAGPCARCNGSGAIAHPLTVAACVVFASDPRGLLAAEALAREITGCARVVWRVVPREQMPTLRTAIPGGGWLPALDVGAVLATGYAISEVTEATVALVCPAL